jgi:hypothetical protein
MAPPHPDWEEDALSEGDATPVEGAIAVREEDALRERDATPQDSRDSEDLDRVDTPKPDLQVPD